MKIGIDCDGVMYDFAKAFNQYLRQNDYFGDGVEDPGDDWVPPRYNWYQDWGMSTEHFLHLCARGVDEGFLFTWGDPFEGCVEALATLREWGHSIHIITHRTFGQRSVHNTVDWFNEHKIKFDTITFAEDKTIVGVDLLLDDYEKNWRASIDQGIPCVIFDQPWNEHLEDADRVSDWEDFLHFVGWLDAGGDFD